MSRFFFAFLLFTFPLAATWEIRGASLYWRPCGGTFVVGTPQEGRDPRILNTDYDWGYRIGITAMAPDCSGYWYGHYTRVDSAASEEYEDLFTLGEVRLSADAHREVRYETATAGLSFSMMGNRQLSLYLYGGPRWVNVDDRRKITAEEAEQTERFAFTGYGGEVGVAGDLVLQGCAGVHAHIGGCMLVGQQRTRLNSIGFPSETVCTPGMDVKVATTYTIGGSDYCLTFEAGYDLTFYFSLLRRISATGVVTTFDLGFHGPYTGLRLNF